MRTIKPIIATAMAVAIALPMLGVRASPPPPKETTRTGAATAPAAEQHREHASARQGKQGHEDHRTAGKERRHAPEERDDD
jgi:hypothetical protein